MKHKHYDLAMKAAKDKGLQKWCWSETLEEWLEAEGSDWLEDTHYAVGDKPTNPPRKPA